MPSPSRRQAPGRAPFPGSAPSTSLGAKRILHRNRWLIAALLLLGLASWLMTKGESRAPGARAQKDVKPEFPRRLDPDGWARSNARLTLPPAPSSAEPETPPVRRDPVLTALSPRADMNLVFEAGAVRDSPLGQMFLRCYARAAKPELEALKQHGLDLVNDIDRIAISDDLVVLSGNFGAVHWEDVWPGKIEDAESFRGSKPASDTEPSGKRAVTYGPGLVLTGSTAAIDGALARLDGRAGEEALPIAPSETYGEIYGVLNSPKIAELVPEDLRGRFAGATRKVELHIGARDDALLVADVYGPDRTRVDELGRALGGALSLARMKARAENDDTLAELLEGSRVALNGDSFRLEVALPMSTIAAALGSCASVDGGP